MKLKNKNQVPDNGFVFLFKTEHDGSPITGEIQGNSLSQLTERVRESFKNQGIEVPDNIAEVIEHQICLRQNNPEESCWSGGIGDTLHHKFIAPFLNAVAKKLAVPSMGKVGIKMSKAAISIASCSSCAGTKVYDPSANNLGRAGTLNHIIK